MSEMYISNQIAVYKTDKKLVEFKDKLNLAPKECYARIHASAADFGDGRRIYSNIGILLMDYSAGKGEKNIQVEANISPEEAMFIFSRVNASVEKFEFQNEKIFGLTDNKGYAIMRKLRIVRANTDTKGQPRKYPWYLEVDNGKGKKASNSNGGSYCQSGTYVSEKKVYANLNDLDFYRLMCRVSQYICAWELAMGCKLIKEGRVALEESLAEYAKNKQ